MHPVLARERYPYGRTHGAADMDGIAGRSSAWRQPKGDHCVTREKPTTDCFHRARLWQAKEDRTGGETCGLLFLPA